MERYDTWMLSWSDPHVYTLFCSLARRFRAKWPQTISGFTLSGPPPAFGCNVVSRRLFQVLETERLALEHDRAELLLEKARSMLAK